MYLLVCVFVCCCWYRMISAMQAIDSSTTKPVHAVSYHAMDCSMAGNGFSMPAIE